MESGAASRRLNGSMEKSKVVVGRKTGACEALQTYHPESLQCVQCLITFRDARAMERHARKYHPEQFKQHLQQMNTLFTCYKCDRRFVCPEELSHHQRTHAAHKKPLFCTYCQQPFSGFPELSKHKRCECTLRERFCRDCNTLFSTPPALRLHRKAVHSGPPKAAHGDAFQCSVSNRCFPTEEGLLPPQEFSHFLLSDYSVDDWDVNSQSSELQSGIRDEEFKHEEIQEKDGPVEREGSQDSDRLPSVELKIPCPAADCDCMFPSVEALRSHKRNEHGPPPQKGLCSACPTCGKTFARPSALKTHQASHRRVQRRLKK